MTYPLLKTVVIRSSNLDATRAFYEVLGMAFLSERHGEGPLHYSSVQPGWVLEIYPGNSPGLSQNWMDCGATSIGFAVESIQSVLIALTALNTTVLREPRKTAWGIRAVVQDPDGRAVEIYQT